MSEPSAIDRILRTNDIFSLEGGAEENARQAREMLDTFTRVNDIIQSPDTANPSLNRRMQETAEFSRPGQQAGQGLKAGHLRVIPGRRTPAPFLPKPVHSIFF